MNSSEPDPDDIYVAEEVVPASASDFNPFDTPQTETAAGTTRPPEESWSATMLLAVTFGAIIACTCAAGSIYLFIEISDDPSLMTMVAIFVSVLGSMALGVFVAVMIARRGAAKERNQKAAMTAKRSDRQTK